jgi:hypothetical protein
MSDRQSTPGRWSFLSVLKTELFNRRVFTTLNEARVLIEDLRKEYNQGEATQCAQVPPICS